MRLVESFYRIHLAGLTVFMMAGSAAAQARLSQPVVETLPHGIVRVRNTGPSRWLGTNGWKFVLERTIAPPDGSAALIGEPYALAIDRTGQIYETDWKVDGIQVFAPDGKYLRTMGRKGDGPGEFKVPIDLDIHGDTLAALAGNQARVSLWRISGQLLTSFMINDNYYSAPIFADHGDILLRTNTRVGSHTRQIAVHWRPTGKIVDTTLLPLEPEYPAWRSDKGTFTIPFTAFLVGTFDSHARYVSGNSAHNSLVVARNGSDTARIIELPGKRVPVSSVIADSLFKRMTARPPLSTIAKRGDIPTEQPFFKELYADELDNIWIVRPDAGGKLASFDVIDAEGRFLGSVAPPSGRADRIVFRNGRMYCISENADGVPVIQVYRIDKGTK